MIATDEVIQLEEIVALQESALSQHRAAERHWATVGDIDRVEAALWRQQYVSDLLDQLRGELTAARAA